ncbi:S26 family signal peptidase [Streptomyces sp. NPDC127074]|uniref:S26 family signal peptidase n=1 Tax=Streptomyces sp. NPDC127074 TaxID=3347130 RepID=UPI003662972C
MRAAVLALAPLAGWVLAVMLIRRRYLVVVVQGASMTPTLSDGDRVLVRRCPLVQVHTRQLVVTGRPTGKRWEGMRMAEWVIKRAAAVPGDLVPKEGAPALRDLPEHRVPEGRIVLLGDNPADSLDSRFCGYFRSEQIVGVVVRTLPPDASRTVRSSARRGHDG